MAGWVRLNAGSFGASQSAASDTGACTVICTALRPAEESDGRIGEFLERLAHRRQIGHAHGSELDPARQALEQRKSQMCLERADLIADRTRTSGSVPSRPP